MMDNLKSILDFELLDFSMTKKEMIEHREDFINLIFKEIKDYYLNKLPKEKTFDSMANSSQESINNAKIYNKCLNQIRKIIKKG